MTPTVARMVAAKQRDLSLPIRWYSIPNLFRYEKPQRGRLREHFQLNVDIFGTELIDADIETLSVASDIMNTLGATTDLFTIKINDRKIVNDLYAAFSIKAKDAQKLSKVIDKKDKISANKFSEAVSELIGDTSEEFIEVLNSNELLVKKLGETNENIKNLINLIEQLDAAGIKNVEFTPTLMRGFDYYTGLIFEIFDTNPENPRALFGGGRYDNLLSIFGKEPLPAVGFGVGDVTMRDFLETHDLLPAARTETDIYFCKADSASSEYMNRLARSLRNVGINVATDVTDRKIAGQIKAASKKGIRFIACIGESESQSGVIKIKNIETGDEQQVDQTKVAQFLIDHRD